MLVPIARNVLPPVISVPGPGPTEPRNDTLPLPSDPSLSRAAAPTISRSNSDLDASQALHDDFDHSGDDHGEDEGDEEELSTRTGALAVRSTTDPYANLNGAFGNYSAEEPRPQPTDDLLF